MGFFFGWLLGPNFLFGIFRDCLEMISWETYYDTIGFKAMCFLEGEIDKCYVKSDMLKIISY